MATLTGWFPAPDLPILKQGDNSGFYKKQGGSSTYTDFRTVDGFGEAQFLVDELRNRWSNQTNYSTRDYFVPEHNGPFAVRVSGKPTPNPPDKVLLGRIVKQNNKPFKKRVKDGEMVVSNYVTSRALLQYQNGGGRQIHQTKHFARSVRHASTVFDTETWKWENRDVPVYTYNSSSIALGQYLWGGATPCFGCPYYYLTRDDATDPYKVGWNDHVIQNFLDKELLDMIDVDPQNEVVTATIAEANMRTVDVLTALAEAPETVNSIKNGVMEVIRLFIDARKRHIGLLTKAKRVQRQHEEKIYRVQFEFRQQWLKARNDRSRRIIEHKRQQTVAQLRKDLQMSLKSIGDAVTQIWLTYRYGIMPNVYLVNDLVEAAQAELTEFHRLSQKRTIEIVPPEMPGWKSEGTILGTLRCFDKRKFETKKMADAPYAFVPAVTLWELVPLSFVVDWFLNIGEVLAFLFGSSPGYTQVNTISVKMEGTPITYIHEQSGATVKVTFGGYTRKVIDPLRYCALRWDPYVDLQRKLDAASLTWQIFAKDALKGLINNRK